MRENPCNCDCGPMGRRDFLTAAASVAASPALAKGVATPPQRTDEGFMRLALEEASKGDFPFGAVIVRDGKVAATGCNSGIRNNDPTAHGEIVAIRAFCARNPAEKLKGATIYTTGEPCPMCMGAILWSGFSRMVYAASIEQLSTKIGQIMTPSASLAKAAPFHKIDITGGLMAKEALALFK